MRQEEHGLEEQLYCICRSSDASRFMIGCDYCEEWYHGDCIDITEEESRFIRKFFCPKCRERDPTLTIKYKQKKLEQVGREETKKAKKRRERKDSISQYPHCGACIACYRVDNCGKCDACFSKSRQQCKHRICLSFAPKKKEAKLEFNEEMKAVLKEANYSDEDVWEPSLRKEKIPIVTKPSRHSSNKKEKPKGRHRSSGQRAAGREKDGRRKRITSSTDSAGNDTDLDRSPIRTKAKVVHCFGPQCANPSRSGSKYCSDQCGLNLATARIYQILPQRIQEWNMTPCTAEERNKKELEHIRKQQIEARATLEELDFKHKEIDSITAKVQSFTVDDSDDEADEVGDGEAETATVNCVTCGHGLTVRTAIRHMERCFNKFESQTSFGSIFQTKIEGNNMFCDFFNPANGTYCKRLRVLCPEHCKDPKVNDSEVCGYPLVKNVFEATSEFCLVQKKKCSKHNNWEKLRRAEIDMERVHQWLKLDELFDKERQIRQAMAQRAGLLPLLLHSTFNHEIAPQQYTSATQNPVGEHVGDKVANGKFADQSETQVTDSKDTSMFSIN